ncbi:MAG: FAD-binding oxidoreductase [Candidatus Dormibacteria bacterium]
MTASSIDAFRSTFTGVALISGDDGYDAARSVWNGAIDRSPALIARCSSAGEVAEAIRYARDNGLEIAVRGGGHNYAGTGVCDGGLMIDLSPMNQVSVDPGRRRAACGGGATWEALDAAAQEHGLATPGGFISHTGVGGLTLGGGVGWLTKQAGLSCDNLVGAEVVTAESRVVHASADENPDLFWALRGGGGNFGVVTSFELALHEVGPMVNLGFFFWGLDRGTEALRFSRDFVKTLPSAANAFLAIALSAPPEPFVPEQYHGMTGHALLVVGFGSPEAHAAAIAPIRESIPPLFEMVTPIPYVALQQMFNGGALWGTFGYEKALYLDELSDGALEVIAEYAPMKNSPQAFCPTFALTGAYLNRTDEETAFGGHRSEGYVFNISGDAPTEEAYEAGRAWVRAFWDAMRAHARDSSGYVNFQTDVDEDRVRSSYGPEKYARLAEVKASWDPENVFHLNVNIRPA